MTAPVDSGPSLMRGNSTRSKTQQDDPLVPGSFFINNDGFLVDPDNVTVNYSSINVREGAKSRAQPLVQRLEGWHLVLREILEWLEAVAKLNNQSSEIFYHRILPHVAWTDSKVKRGTPLSSVMHGFRNLTTRVAASQQDAGNRLSNEFIPELDSLAKECRQRALLLEQDRQLRMGELLKRADATQKSIALLSRQCQAAMSTGGSGSQDPWVTNLHVLRNLQREVQEDNRLRTASISIQRQISHLEERVILALKKAVQYCFDHYAASAASKEVARIQRTLEKMDPRQEWEQFMAKEASDLVIDETEPLRDYLHIRYNNRFHPAVMTLHKGKLDRRSGGVRKQYSERYFVLTQCGYLHQFNESDKVNPELSIFIPKSTIVPSIDISHYSEQVNSPGTPFTFEIRRPTTLQREKSHVLRARSREELLTWCRLLVDVATRNHGHSTWKNIQRNSTIGPNQGDLRIDTSARRYSDSPKHSLTTPKSPVSKHEISQDAESKSAKGKERAKDVPNFDDLMDDEPLDQLKKATSTDNGQDKTPVKVIEPLFRNSDLEPVVAVKDDELKALRASVEEALKTPKANGSSPVYKNAGISEVKATQDVKHNEEIKIAEEVKTKEENKVDEEPRATEKPAISEEPNAIEEPKATEDPKTTEEPEAAEAIKTAEVPKATEGSRVTEEAPKDTEEAPKGTEETLKNTEETLKDTEETLKDTETPKVAEEPKAAKEPIAAERSQIVEEPTVASVPETKEEEFKIAAESKKTDKTDEEIKATESDKAAINPSKPEVAPTNEETPAPVSFLSYLPQLSPFSSKSNGTAKQKDG